MDRKRRHWLVVTALSASGTALAAARSARRPRDVFTVATFGDSILDCGHYNDHGVHPGRLIVRNDDHLFPQFKGRDLASSGPARLVHRARDGARVEDLPAQARGLRVTEPGAALITVGGNDLLAGLAADGAGIARFERHLATFLATLSLKPVLLANVYDPTFGDDARNFLAVDARVARANFNRMNEVIAELAARHGQLVDLHRHFLGGDASWFTQGIEPSFRGASEVRAAFLPAVLRARG